ncbi:MAG TPA: 2Fe-2S iron-sulfur cluster-binding protein [Novosphingobium sp.]
MPKIRFVQHDGREDVIDAAVGESVMRAALSHGVPGIVADCGGFLGCATCHVFVADDWADRLAPPSEDEETMLEMAVEPTEFSRLSCQIVVDPDMDGLTLRVPERQF